MASVLVVDDERSMRELLTIFLAREGHDVTTTENGEDAAKVVRSRAPDKCFDLVVTDLKMPGKMSGLDVLAEVKEHAPHTQVIMVTAFATTETAIDALKRGAYDYLTKPFKIDEISVVIQRALERQALVRANAELRERVHNGFRLSALLGKSPAMQSVFDLIRRIGPSRSSVLITGESGTGKELVARALHEQSGRKDRPFVAINCGAIPETLLESELFGHEKGAFTGAVDHKEGLFAAADQGTLFLDEVGELPPQTQVKLLRALQERKVKPVGGVKELAIDTRVVAATNRDLDAEVAHGTFRQDLYYRLNVIQVHVPPLREHREDIPLLAEHFLRRYVAETGKPIHTFSRAALAKLCDYHYPGNVRELENLVERGVTLESGHVLDIESLPPLARAPLFAGAEAELPEQGFALDQVLSEYERSFLEKALDKTGGGKKAAARLLGISFRSLRYRLSKLGFAPDDGESEAGPD